MYPRPLPQAHLFLGLGLAGWHFFSLLLSFGVSWCIPLLIFIAPAIPCRASLGLGFVRCRSGRHLVRAGAMPAAVAHYSGKELFLVNGGWPRNGFRVRATKRTRGQVCAILRRRHRATSVDFLYSSDTSAASAFAAASPRALVTRP